MSKAGTSRIESLNTMLDLTREMLSAAQRQEWPKVVELAAQRQVLLESVFRESIPATETESVAELTRHVHALNEDLIRLSTVSRETLSQALSQISRGRRAQSAYGQKTNP